MRIDGAKVSTMKKTILLVLVLAALVSLAACSGKEQKPPKPDGNGNGSKYTDANDLYAKLWNTFSEEERFYAIGGDEENRTENGPGKYDISKYKDDYVYRTLVSPQLLPLIENEASTLQFMMNTNSFSSTCIKLKKNSDADTFAEGFKKTVLENEWMCGFPDRVTVVQIDEYLIAAYGIDDFMDAFKKNVQSFSSETTILVDEPVIGY